MSCPLATASAFARRLRWACGVVASLGVAVAIPGAARADGAFPESFQMIAPVDRPHEVALGTNFGLFLSEDDGATWTWTCEQGQTSMASLYGVGPPPLDRFFALSSLVGLAYSDDETCTWTSAAGSLGSLVAVDYFPDPIDPMHVLALGAPLSGTPGQVLPSMDGGRTFGAPIFTAPPSGDLISVEIARSDPRTIYVSMFGAPAMHPSLVRSRDGGATWTTIDLGPSLGTNYFLLIAVDPNDAMSLLLRVLEPSGESVSISHDGGGTFTKTLAFDKGALSSYARTKDGTMFLGGAAGVDGRAFKSTDGGATWQDWLLPTTLRDGTQVPTLHLRALAARGGALYAAAKNYSDDVAVAVSTDGGRTFIELMRYDDVKGIRACAQAACADSCRYQSSQAVWDIKICGDGATNEGGDGATNEGGDGATDEGGDDAVGSVVRAASSGCGCAIGPEGAAAAAGGGATLLVAFWLAARRRRARASVPSAQPTGLKGHEARDL